MKFFAIATVFLGAALLALPGHQARADDRDDDFAAPKLGESDLPQANIGADPRKAVVVVGLACNDDENIQVIKLLFGRNDPSTGDWMKDGFLRDEFAVERRLRSVFYQAPLTTDPTVPTYHVVEVNPGEWVLHALYALYGQSKKENRTTKLSPPGEDKLGDSVGPRFVVKAGEVAYIGTYNLNMTSFPGQLAKVTRDDAAAKQALAAQTKLQTDPVYRPVYLKKR